MKILTEKQSDRILECLIEIEKYRETIHVKNLVEVIRDVILQGENVELTTLIIKKEDTP